MTLRSGIRFLLIVPLAALAILGLWTTGSELRSVRDGFQSRGLIAEAVDLGALVHRLQVERGQSAGFLASSGRNFADTLPAERELTDAAWAALPAGMAAGVVDRAALQEMRTRVTAQDTSVPEMAKFYTAAIRGALSRASDRLRDTRQPETMALGAAIVALSDAKEWAGLQRAAGATGLGQGVFAPPVYRAFVQRGAAERGLLTVAEPVLRQHIDALDLSAAIEPTGIGAFREAIEAGAPGVDLSAYAAPDWFAASTRWIEVLREIEVTASDRLAELASAAAMRALATTVVALLLALSAAAGCLWVGRRLLRRFDTQIGTLGTELSRLARKEFDFVPAYMQEPSEVGALSASLEQARAALEAADGAMERTRVEVLSILEGHLQRLAGRDLRARIETPFPGEYDGLRKSFNAALGQLQAAMTQIGAAVDGIHGGATDLNGAASKMAQRTENQAASLEQTNAALQQIADSANATVASVQTAKGAMDALQSDADGGMVQVGEASRAMADIVAAADEMTVVVELIQDVAFQTNLLALNAGVEAARAGESGKGFAVVAAEVRGLALRAADATNEIKTLIDRSNDFVSEGVSKVEATGDVFRRITSGIAETSGSVGEIADKAVDQSRGVTEIRTAMQQLDEMTQHNAAMATGNAELSTRLKGEADTLSDLVSTFGAGAAPGQASRPARLRRSA